MTAGIIIAIALGCAAGVVGGWARGTWLADRRCAPRRLPRTGAPLARPVSFDFKVTDAATPVIHKLISGSPWPPPPIPAAPGPVMIREGRSKPEGVGP